ncbi:hypothetical protein [Paenarthrobacter aurescens]|jgi:hypothetical protein|uniref:Uncharacterized protein n=1 Tax=Paenarthrobacter aurescens (strain TC1) TaxID=290340 RepID=A1R9H0_PAEAT|nr:hypothetical protein [Paenarthrobacter aurescens]ABM08347.1 hypothetical protein AAur_3185 [Paenarthrobacter aurescens TC1]
MSSTTTALQGGNMLDTHSFSVILAVHPVVQGQSSPEYSIPLTPAPVRVPAGRGLTVGRPLKEAAEHYDHVAIPQEIIGSIPVGIVPERALNLIPVRLPDGSMTVAASLTASNPDYWCIGARGQRTGPDVWHRLYDGDAVTILRRGSIRDDWDFFLRAQIFNKNLERPDTPAGSGTLLSEPAMLEREAKGMASNLRRDLFGREIQYWGPWALVIAAVAALISANKTDRLQERINAVLDNNPALAATAPSASRSDARATTRNTQFIRPQDTFRVLSVRYESLAPAALKGYSFERLFGIDSPLSSGDDARRLFYKQLWRSQIITKDELDAVAPYLGLGAKA